jgi:hypothetical protein
MRYLHPRPNAGTGIDERCKSRTAPGGRIYVWCANRFLEILRAQVHLFPRFGRIAADRSVV